MLLFSQPGALPASGLEAVIRKVQEVDMEHVRAELDRERAARESPAVHRVCPATRRGELG